MTTAPVKPTPTFLEADLDLVDEADSWEVTGLAVPFGEEMARPHWATGATRQRIDGATVLEGSQLFYGHDHLNGGLPIGLITEATPEDAGLRIKASISKTPKGAEVRTLLLDGVLSKFSVGYFDDVWRVEEDGALLVHENVNVFETSVVPRPQYDSAVVDGVLHTLHPAAPTPQEGSTPMTDTLVKPEDITALSEAVSTIERQVATLGTTLAQGNASGPDVPVPGESFGEFLQMVAAGEPGTLDFLAYVGGVVGDLGDWTKDSWVGDIIRVVEKPRHAMEFFEKGPLPASGMGVEFGKILADTVTVGKQEAEGDVLPYGKITFTTDRASLDTYGGWGEMSKQEVERSAMQVVERFFTALVRKYGVVTEAAVRSRLAAATGAHSVAGTDLSTADGWIRFMVKAASHLDAKGLAPEAVFVSEDVFIDLATLRDGAATDAPRLLNRDSGSMSVVGLSGDLFSVPVKMLGTLPADTVRVADSAAIKTFESAGAPFRLQDEDITNLTNAYSCYGYLAVAEQEPDAIVIPGV